jgi:hypothetical protein
MNCGSSRTYLVGRSQPVFIDRWPQARRHAPAVALGAGPWPPAKALATGRALVLCDALSAPTDGGLGAAVRGVLAELPWARVTITAREGDPEPWWRMGVEVLLREDPTTVRTERPDHYDITAIPSDLASPAALETLRAAASHLEARRFDSASTR